MNLSTVVIIGRPNVGKSTLFNRIAKKRSAIVDFVEGVTRDRKYEEVEWSGTSFILTDTGGIITDSEHAIDKEVRKHAEIAISEGELIIFLVDTKVGTTDVDMEIANFLRPYHDRVLLVANKTDNEKDQLEVYDFMSLGYGEAFPIAAVNGRNIGNLLDIIINRITPLEYQFIDDDSIKVSFVGKPN
ncbi:MAG: 50S ribosome-binding GTPase, partial [Candidatus Cloacimonetes bacterium]|nr:50S ribosome-binding GTPase [Candidatus Cloacimonadota bacterium]